MKWGGKAANKNPQKFASGAALLGLLMVLLMAGLAWLVRDATHLNRAAVRNPVTERALSEAREALLGYAAAYPELHLKGGRAVFIPGQLPCPDMGSSLGHEGTESGACGSEGVTVIGHFPWRSLGIPPPRDGYGECLWYAVSGSYKANPKGRLLNPDIAGQFQILDRSGRIVAGATAATRPVAVLFAPGRALPGQERVDSGGECRWNYDAGEFLEAWGDIDNARPNAAPDAITRLVIGQEEAGFNDRLLWIDHSELFERVARRPSLSESLFDPQFGAAGAAEQIALTQRVASCLARFGSHNEMRRLPWAAPMTLTGNAPLTFQNDAFADQQNLRAGRPPFQVARSQVRLASTLGSLATCTSSGQTACRLLRVENCPELAAVMGDSNTYGDGRGGWFEKWKDHLFYVVAPGFAPADIPAADCVATPGACLEVGGRAYAAAVIFAGAPLAGQTRETDADRMEIRNYMEGENAETLQNQGLRLEAAGNDRIVCIAPQADGAFTLVPDCAAP